MSDLLLQAWMVCVVIMLALGVLIALVALGRKVVEGVFWTVGRPLGGNWLAFCERTEAVTNRALRPFIYLLGAAFIGLMAVSVAKDPTGGCGWAGVFCEGESAE